ncbi:MAG: flippase-like domain-containing protein [SAR202 cluster bacterium]|nr:flippase-like domain-containing protein [SAR202 cluster bacterium]
MANNGGEQNLTSTLRKRIFSLPTLVSFGVAIIFLFFLATRFDLDWGQTWESIRSMDPWQYLLALSLYYASFYFRGIRWMILSRSAGLNDTPGAKTPTVLQFSQMIVMGWFVNSVAWLRAGDFYRAYALSDKARTSFSWSLGTIFAERIMDMATVMLIIVVGALAFVATSDLNSAGVLALGIAVGLAVLVISALVLMKLYGVRLASRLPKRLEEKYQRFHLGTVGSFKQLPIPFVLSIIGWTLEIARLYFVVKALGFEIGIPLVIIVALGHAMLSTVPTPGGVGAVETGVTSLLLLGMTRHDAAAVAIVDRSITYLSVIIIGGILFFLWQVARSRSNRPSDTRRTPPLPGEQARADGG